MTKSVRLLLSHDMNQSKTVQCQSVPDEQQPTNIPHTLFTFDLPHVTMPTSQLNLHKGLLYMMDECYTVINDIE